MRIRTASRAALAHGLPFFSELRRRLAKSGAHRRLNVEPSNAPSKNLGGRSPVTASSGLCAHFIASIRKHGPHGLLLTQWPVSFSYHRALLSHSPFICMQNLAVLLVNVHCLATAVNQYPHPPPPPHTPNLCAPPGSLSYSPQPGNPELPSASFVEISNCHSPHPYCAQKETRFCLACGCLRARRASVGNGSSLSNKRTKVG